MVHHLLIGNRQSASGNSEIANRQAAIPKLPSGNCQLAIGNPVVLQFKFSCEFTLISEVFVAFTNSVALDR